MTWLVVLGAKRNCRSALEMALMTHLWHARFRLSAAQFDDHSHFADRNLLF